MQPKDNQPPKRPGDNDALSQNYLSFDNGSYQLVAKIGDAGEVQLKLMLMLMLKSMRIFLMEFPVSAILVFCKCNFHIFSTKTYLCVNLIHRNAFGHLRSKVIQKRSHQSTFCITAFSFPGGIFSVLCPIGFPGKLAKAGSDMPRICRSLSRKNYSSERKEN